MSRTFTNPSAFTNFDEAHKVTMKNLAHKSNAYMRKREQASEKIDKENEVMINSYIDSFNTFTKQKTKL